MNEAADYTVSFSHNTDVERPGLQSREAGNYHGGLGRRASRLLQRIVAALTLWLRYRTRSIQANALTPPVVVFVWS